MHEANMTATSRPRLSVDPAWWTHLYRWTPAQALLRPGRSVQREALVQAGEEASTRAFLAELPDDRSRVIAVSNMFGPNLLPEDIAEFLTAIGPCTVTTSQVEDVLDNPEAASRRAVVSVAEEMPSTRAEIAQVASAVRDLTRTLDSALGELGSRVAEVERTLDTNMVELIGEVSEVCTELAEIGAALQRVPEPTAGPSAGADDWVPVKPRRRRWLLGGGR